MDKKEIIERINNSLVKAQDRLEYLNNSGRIDYYTNYLQDAIQLFSSDIYVKRKDDYLYNVEWFCPRIGYIILIEENANIRKFKNIDDLAMELKSYLDRIKEIKTHLK